MKHVVIWLFPFSSFLFSHTDDIIILRKIENTSTEEKEMETQNESEKNSVSKCQLNDSRHHKQRGKVYKKTHVIKRV